jgi:poly(3-hydroxybutyrate) depolymerase
MEEITTWKSVAARERIVVAFPDGGTFLGPWNVGENVCNIGQVVAGPTDQDDLGFVQAIIDAANVTQPINKSAVFVGSFSMGELGLCTMKGMDHGWAGGPLRARVLGSPRRSWATRDTAAAYSTKTQPS